MKGYVRLAEVGDGRYRVSETGTMRMVLDFKERVLSDIIDKMVIELPEYGTIELEYDAGALRSAGKGALVGAAIFVATEVVKEIIRPKNAPRQQSGRVQHPNDLWITQDQNSTDDNSTDDKWADLGSRMGAGAGFRGTMASKNEGLYIGGRLDGNRKLVIDGKIRVSDIRIN